jgi:hypothetical protein
MLNLDTFFKARFKTTLAGMEFLAEVDCDNLEELSQHCNKAAKAEQEIELIAAMIGIELNKPNGGCYLLDDESEKLLVSVMKELKVGAEHFFNERLGSYDVLNNKVTPADLGMVFPDGTIRVVWDEESATQDFDTCLTILKGVVELLIQAQDMTYFKYTEEEYEANDYESLTNRRIELLFGAGLWPADDGSFEPETPQKVQLLLTLFENKAIPRTEPA